MRPSENIKNRISRFNLTYVWLINELSRTHGVETDKTEMSSVLAGTRKGAKADAIITASEEILTKYEQLYFQRNN